MTTDLKELLPKRKLVHLTEIPGSKVQVNLENVSLIEYFIGEDKFCHYIFHFGAGMSERVPTAMRNLEEAKELILDEDFDFIEVAEGHLINPAKIRSITYARGHIVHLDGCTTSVVLTDEAYVVIKEGVQQCW